MHCGHTAEAAHELDLVRVRIRVRVRVRVRVGVGVSIRVRRDARLLDLEESRLAHAALPGELLGLLRVGVRVRVRVRVGVGVRARARVTYYGLLTRATCWSSAVCSGIEG